MIYPPHKTTGINVNIDLVWDYVLGAGLIDKYDLLRRSDRFILMPEIRNDNIFVYRCIRYLDNTNLAKIYHYTDQQSREISATLSKLDADRVKAFKIFTDLNLMDTYKVYTYTETAGFLNETYSVG